MQVVDNRAFSVMFAVLFIPDSWSRIYRGILSGARSIFDAPFGACTCEGSERAGNKYKLDKAK